MQVFTVLFFQLFCGLKILLNNCRKKAVCLKLILTLLLILNSKELFMYKIYFKLF